MMNQPPSTYLSYLLRLRWADNAGQPVWRISLEVPGSQTRQYFESLAALCAYLAAQMGLVEGKGGTIDKTEEESNT